MTLHWRKKFGRGEKDVKDSCWVQRKHNFKKDADQTAHQLYLSQYDEAIVGKNQMWLSGVWKGVRQEGLRKYDSRLTVSNVSLICKKLLGTGDEELMQTQQKSHALLAKDKVIEGFSPRKAGSLLASVLGVVSIGFIPLFLGPPALHVARELYCVEWLLCSGLLVKTSLIDSVEVNRFQ